MDIAKGTRSGLRSLAGSKIPDGDFATLVNLIFTQAKDASSRSKLSTTELCAKHFKDVDNGLIKQAHACLMAVILEAAKTDSGADALSEILEESGISDKRRQEITRKYEENKPSIRDGLSRIGHSFPKIVNMKWRLDYLLRSSAAGKVLQPLYLVDLVTLQHGELRTLNMSFTLEQLKHFLTKMEDAEGQVDRVLSDIRGSR